MPIASLEPTAQEIAYEKSEQGGQETAAPVKDETQAAPEQKETVAKSKPSGRDDKGRFSGGKADEEEVRVEAKEEAEKPVAKSKELPRVAAPKSAPVGALQDERRKRQDAQDRYSTLEDQYKTLQREVAALKNPPKTPPDPNLDPDGYNRFRIDELASKVQTYEKETEAQKKQREQYETVQNRINSASEYEQASLEEFKSARPDQRAAYLDAVKYYQEKMRGILPGFGIRGDMVEQTINDMLLRAVEDARSSGENAAERIWNLAGNLGYQMKSKQVAEPEPEAAIEQPGQDDEALRVARASLDKLTTLAEGQRASKSLAGGGGKVNQSLTLKELLSKSEGASLLDETDMDKLTIAQEKKLFGG